jgi:hypothetical protein
MLQQLKELADILVAYGLVSPPVDFTPLQSINDVTHVDHMGYGGVETGDSQWQPAMPCGVYAPVGQQRTPLNARWVNYVYPLIEVQLIPLQPR